MDIKPVLHLDKSDARLIVFELDGQRVEIERVFESGFTVRGEDVPCVLTLLQNFLRGRDS